MEEAQAVQRRQRDNSHFKYCGVASLAASGMTTRDIAGALFISPKTVETNLARIYRKLGIRTRAELGRVMRDGDTAPTAS